MTGRRKALLLTTSPRNDEIEELVFALGADLVGTVHQRRAQPDPQFFLGRGKAEEARDAARALGADLVVVHGALKPSQIFGLRRFFAELPAAGGADGRAARDAGRRDAAQIEVYDRTRLILEIFRERARSPEARLQVELAQLTYDMPLVKEAIHLEKRGERQAAMFGGGQYGVSEYHDMMKRRMARIRRELERMRGERAVRRKHRRRSGFELVSLAGYTNAGKSSLLRALAQRDTLVENRYFSTLSTKTARAQSERREILVTDTVGFIEDLPPWMVEAFHSTLEEIALADVILLVLDASDPPEEMLRRLRSSLRILWSFDVGSGADAAAAPWSEASAQAAAQAHAQAQVQPQGSAREGEAPADGRTAATAEDDTDAMPMTHHDVEGTDADAEDADAAPTTPDARAPTVTGSATKDGRPAAALSPMRPRTPSLGAAARRGPAGLAPLLLALNKADRLAPGEVEQRARLLVEEGLVDPESIVVVSAKTRDGLDALFERLYALLPDHDEYEVALPPSGETESLLAWLHGHTDVMELARGDTLRIRFEAKRSLRASVMERLERVGAVAIVDEGREPVASATPADDTDAPSDATPGATTGAP